MLTNGQVVAFMAMGGKPIDWVEKLDGNVYTLANVDTSDISALGQPYYPVKLTYRNLGVMGVTSITARNDIVVWDYTSGRNVEKMLRLRKFIKENLEEIKEARGSHPAWQDVEKENLDDVSWQAYQPAGVAAPKAAIPAKKRR